MSKFNNFRFDLPIMFCLIAILAVVVYLVKAVKFKVDEAARPVLHLHAVSYVLPNRPDLPPIRTLNYSVRFPGLNPKRSDLYTDHCTGVEPGFLNQVSAAGSNTLHVAEEPGLLTQAKSSYPPITKRMQANFELLQKLVAEHNDIRQIDWSANQAGNSIFSLTIKLPADFPTALP